MGDAGVERGVVGWDVGGVRTKAVRVAGGRITASAARPYELQHAPDALPGVLAELFAQVGGSPDDRHAVTMTAELSQHFVTKADGVAWVLDGLRASFGDADIRVAASDGVWHGTAEAAVEWRSVASANWALTARAIARRHPDVLLIDVGSTTTDLVPIVGGRIVAAGSDDPGRLAVHELVYTGAVRTPVEALVSQVPFAGALANCSAEQFALAGDVHVWLGRLAPEAYDTATPDRRPVDRAHCGARLARVVCADRTMLTDRELDVIADYIAETQVQRIAQSIRLVLRRHPGLRTAVVVGLGDWLGVEAATAAGLRVVPVADELAGAHVLAPAAAAALLLAGIV